MILREGEAVQTQPADGVAAHCDDQRFVARVFHRRGDGVIEHGRFRDGPLALVGDRRMGHERGIDDEHIAVAVRFQKLDGPLHHPREGRLLAAEFDLVRVRQLRPAEEAHDSALPIRRGVFQLRLGSHEFASVRLHFRDQVGMPVAICRGRLEAVRTAAERDIQLGVHELGRDGRASSRESPRCA